ncbi:MAG: DUF2220 family protein [Mariprofundales bacterium]|nr:DUF2220 family protein [Mariprofundales bacterium]
MSWSDQATDAAAIRQQLMRRWQRGEICRALLDDGACLSSSSQPFPLRLPLKQPSAKVMLEQFAAVRAWGQELRALAEHHGLTLEQREIHHRNLGQNQLPCALHIDNAQQAVALIGKSRELKAFDGLCASTKLQIPQLCAWLARRPLKALELRDAWPQLLTMVQWQQARPTPGIYLRQVDAAGIDSKFIEHHRGVLAELFDLILPADAINTDFSGAAGFARRYGFHDKPLRLRCRPLDPAIRLIMGDNAGCSGDQDITLNADTFAQLNPPVAHIFITENEINYLAFPPLAHSLAIFGSGYGFDALAGADWLHHCTLHYWGDLDSHGFAILDQLRAHFPQAQSLLMDRATLMTHQSSWVREPKQQRRDLPRLTPEEAALYDDLRHNRLGDQLRLEQERIRFADLSAAIGKIKSELNI